MEDRPPVSLWGFHMPSLGALQGTHTCVQGAQGPSLSCVKDAQKARKVSPKRCIYSLCLCVSRAGPLNPHGSSSGLDTWERHGMGKSLDLFSLPV